MTNNLKSTKLELVRDVIIGVKMVLFHHICVALPMVIGTFSAAKLRFLCLDLLKNASFLLEDQSPEQALRSCKFCEMTVNRKELVESLMTRPDAKLVMDEMHEKFMDEEQKRKLFYTEVSENEKAEFINGEVIIHSPVKKQHNNICLRLARLLDIYVQKYDLGEVGIEKMMISLTRNDYEPDICFFGTEKATALDNEQMLFPAPDLIVEVLSKSTAKNDRGVKYNDYESHGVSEYWIIDPRIQTLEQYRLNADGVYELMVKSDSGYIECQPLAGFRIEIKAIFDKSKNLEAISTILAAD